MNLESYLLDTGPLVALLDTTDQKHDRAKKLFNGRQFPLYTNEAVITEACFLTKKGVGTAGPEEVLLLRQKGIYEIPFQLEEHHVNILKIIKKYYDQPISLADACLIRMAEIFEQPHILTFDSDFEIYRWNKTRKFEILS